MTYFTKNKHYKQALNRLTLQEIISLISSKTGSNPKQTGQNYVLNCPAHDDRHASLSVKQSEDQKILFYCFTGCSIDDICASIGIQIKDLFPNNKGNYNG